MFVGALLIDKEDFAMTKYKCGKTLSESLPYLPTFNESFKDSRARS